jgi:hypothetical protein
MERRKDSRMVERKEKMHPLEESIRRVIFLEESINRVSHSRKNFEESVRQVKS